MRLTSRRYTPARASSYVGQAYYNAWYLSRELRKLGWKADVLNWDRTRLADVLPRRGLPSRRRHTALVAVTWTLPALDRQYDIFHFSNAHAIRFSHHLQYWVAERLRSGDEIRLLKRLGKRIVYSNNGCLDGVSQSSFASWGDRPVCDDCAWRNVPIVCSDERNLAWGAFRNSIADYQILVGGNRIDYNVDPRVHEEPEFYCLDEEFWHPELAVPPLPAAARTDGEDLPCGR